MLEKMFDRNPNILATKNVEQTSSHMHASRYNIGSNKCFITMEERVAGALRFALFSGKVKWSIYLNLTSKVLGDTS